MTRGFLGNSVPSSLGCPSASDESNVTAGIQTRSVVSLDRHNAVDSRSGVDGDATRLGIHDLILRV